MNGTGSMGVSGDLVNTQKAGIQNLSYLVQVMQRAGPGAFGGTSTNATATVSPNAYAFTLGTTSAATIGSNQARVGIIFHNASATANIAVCPSLNAATNTALAAVVNGAGSYTLLPYSELRIIGARSSCAWNGISVATTSPLTIWEFVQVEWTGFGNTVFPTRPAGTSDDTPANTQFVQQATASAIASANIGMTLLTTLLASSSVSLFDITSLTNSSFKTFRALGYHIVAGTSAVNFNLLFSTNGGTSYDSTNGHYSVPFQMFNSSPTSAANVFTARAGFNDNTISTAATLTFDVTIFNANTPKSVYVQGQASYLNSTGPNQESCVFGGLYSGGAGVNAMQFITSTGTISTGTIEIFGIP